MESNILISLNRAYDLIFLILILIRVRHGDNNATGGDKRVQPFALGVGKDLPGIYWNSIGFNGYNIDRINCSIGFTLPSWLFLDCHFIHYQLFFTGTLQRSIQKMLFKGFFLVPDGVWACSFVSNNMMVPMEK